jgi:hypothetical protein
MSHAAAAAAAAGDGGSPGVLDDGAAWSAIGRLWLDTDRFAGGRPGS